MRIFRRLYSDSTISNWLPEPRSGVRVRGGVELEWIFLNALAEFDACSDQWDRLNRERDHHLLLDSQFVGGLVKFFASRHTLVGLSQDPLRPGIALVEPSRFGCWKTFTPSQSIVGLIQLQNKTDQLGQIHSLMRGLPGYALSFSLTQQDPEIPSRLDVMENGASERVEYMQTVRLTLSGTFEEYWKRRGKNLTHNLSRQRRRLAEQHNRLELVSYRDPADISACVARYGIIESAGWKAQEGTAIAPENAQGLFYCQVLEAFCRRGEGVVYELVLDGKTIASDLCLERNGTLIILKTTYDESIKGLSPGLLMHQSIFELLYQEGRITVIEFYGRLRDWHTKWTDEIRDMYHVNIYRHSWVSSARQLIKSSSARWSTTKAS